MLGLQVARGLLGSSVVLLAALAACSSPNGTSSGPGDGGLVPYPDSGTGSGSGSHSGSGSGSGSGSLPGSSSGSGSGSLPGSSSGSGSGSLPGSGSGSGNGVCVFDDSTSTFDGPCVFGN
jgi:hypothetical protein